jgi:ribosomal subunit interface protein
MQVLVNSDNNVKATESVSERVESIVADSVDRFADRITRVEVHLSDANADKRGDRDKRCTIEARVGGLAPIAVSHDAATLLEAIDVAAEKLERALDRALGRLEDTPGPTPRDQDIATTELMDTIGRGEEADASSRSPEQIKEDAKLKRALEGAESDDELGRGTDTSEAQDPSRRRTH